MLQTLGQAIARHAATFTEANLAAHLRMIYPEGRWGPVAEPSDDELTPSTAVKPNTITFATRLTPISAAERAPNLDLGSDPGSDPTAAPSDPGAATSTARPVAERDRERRRLAFALVLGAAAVGLVWALARGPESAPEALREQPPEAPTIAASERVPPSQVIAGNDGPSTQPPAGPPVPLPGPLPTVSLQVEPADAAVRIGDQRFEGQSPFTLPLPEQGTHEVTIEAAGFVTEVVVLRPGESDDRSVSLRKQEQGRGQLQVLAPTVPWAEVSVDGRSRGVTPTRKLELPAGPHRVIVRCVPDVCPEPKVLLRRTVEIEADQTTRITAR
ncbi:MAG: PEGA domain-containing protein [Nannocystaceae bacterium]